MEFIPWSSYYEQWKDKKPLNEIIANYNMWKFQYEAQQHSLWLQGKGYPCILMESGDYVLNEDGTRIRL
jgi:hypothetical protein